MSVDLTIVTLMRHTQPYLQPIALNIDGITTREIATHAYHAFHIINAIWHLDGHSRLANDRLG